MRFILTIFMSTLFASGLFSLEFVPSNNKNLAVLYTFDKINDKAFEKFTTQDLKKIGYYLNDPHHRVNDTYEKRFGSTDLSLIGFSSILNEEVVKPLLNKDPRLAGFSPFNLLNYRKKSDMKTVVAHLTPEAILDILEIDDKEITQPYIASFKPLDALITEKLGGKKSYITLKGRAKDTMMNFEIPFKEPEDMDDFLDDFSEKFDEAFEKKGFVIAGFYNIKESFNSDEDVMPEYISFWSYALCHIPFSYRVFDGENALPEVGIFAPCSMYIYVREGENKIVIGMPTLQTWADALGIKDEKKLKAMKLLDRDIREIILSLGAKELPNGNPLLRK